MTKYSFIVAAILLLLNACSTNTNKDLTNIINDEHLIKDATYRNRVEKQFEKQKQLAKNREKKLFGIFDSTLNKAQTDALKFLYAFMPLSDMADYDGKYYLNFVKTTLKAKKEMLWAEKIPEHIFLHFVLPHRINNENLDTFRTAMYPVLKERLEGIDNIRDAALEINHWCHEKVNYTSADIRTSSPLATMKTSWGRCGEESTFTVAALRAVGIPARQCYTPRWAHTDDNHAWVEVWEDGKWYFMGACEPEPNFNMGWFKEPARRAMLVHTKAYGKYIGEEEVVDSTNKYAELNLLNHYAKTKKITVVVKNSAEKVVENATVQGMVYNYAHFYPIIEKKTDENGNTNFSTGLGDILIWAHKNNMFAYKKINVSNTDTVKLIIRNRIDSVFTEEFIFSPPPKNKPFEIDNSGKEENNRRLAIEDSIRNTYKSMFMSQTEAQQLAREYGFDADSVANFIDLSEGNYKEIACFIRTNSKYNAYKLQLLDNISEKDLRDTKCFILLDHLNNAFSNIAKQMHKTPALFAKYVLSPRVDNEMLIAYRSFLQTKFGHNFITNKNVEKLVNWMEQNIKLDEQANYYNVPITPVGVFNLRVSDKHSRDIFFVALCRSYGIAARLNPVYQTPQYYNGVHWVDVYFGNRTQMPKSQITFSSDSVIVPKYFNSFTISRLTNGSFNTLQLPFNATATKIEQPVEVYAGNYLLTTGNRDINGSVYVHLSFFNVPANQQKNIDIKIRDNADFYQPQGIINLENLTIFSTDSSKKNNIEIAGNNALMIWFDSKSEPSQHILKDIQAINNTLNNWTGDCIYISENKDSFTELNELNIRMPENSHFATDNNFGSIQSIEEIIDQKISGNLPLVAVKNKNDELIFYSTGYTIGIGEHIEKVIKHLDENKQ